MAAEVVLYARRPAACCVQGWLAQRAPDRGSADHATKCMQMQSCNTAFQPSMYSRTHNAFRVLGAHKPVDVDNAVYHTACTANFMLLKHKQMRVTLQDTKSAAAPQKSSRRMRHLCHSRHTRYFQASLQHPVDNLSLRSQSATYEHACRARETSVTLYCFIRAPPQHLTCTRSAHHSTPATWRAW
jgi:hypothetical protein